jgi:hypothetical protein
MKQKQADPFLGTQHHLQKKSNDQPKRSTPHGPKHETRHIAMRKTKPRRLKKRSKEKNNTEQVQKQK